MMVDLVCIYTPALWIEIFAYGVLPLAGGAWLALMLARAAGFPCREEVNRRGDRVTGETKE